VTALRSDVTAPSDNASVVVTLPVRGLDCGQCAETLASGLRDSAGIRSATVSFGAGTARVAYDPALTSNNRVVARIRALGYDVPGTPPAGNPSPLIFTISGMDCADCAASVERAVAALPTVASARINLGAGTLTVTPGGESDLSPEPVTAVVSRAGYQATHRTTPLARVARRRWWHDRRLWPVAIALLLWTIGAAIDVGGGSATATTVAYAAALLIGGYPFARAGLQAIRVRRLDMNVLMTISAIGAALLGEWGEGAMVVVLFAIGGTLQALTLDRTRGAIRALMDLSPPEALVVRDGHEEIVPVAALRPGDLVRVKPGGRIPADGRIVEGTAAVDQAAITGESIPVDKAPPDDVFAGTICGAGSLLLEVTRLAADSTLARIVHQVEEAQGSRAPSQALIDRFAAIYTPTVIAGALALALGGALLSDEPRTWVYRALVLLVIACPCALVISTPVSIVAAIGAATRRGILVKGGAALETAGTARVVALDKTGTLTPGRPVVSEIIPLAGSSSHEVLALAAAVELLSEHPLAKAIVARARHDGVTIPTAHSFVALTGRGARAVVDDREVTVGSPRLIAESGRLATNGNAASLEAQIARLAAAGETPLLVATTDRATSRSTIIGLLAVIDAPRPNAAAAISRLRASGVEQITVLTGDTPATGTAIATAVGADDVRAGLLPAEKATAIRELREVYGPVVMVGDGVNDAPALATADVGVAMGAAGTDVALETADLALMGDDLHGVADVLRLSRRTTRIIRQNISLSLAIKVVALVLGAFGFVNLWLAVAADMGTSLVVTLNGMRLGRDIRND